MKIRALVAGLAAATALLSTPTPGALLIRRVFTRDARRTTAQLASGAPDVEVQANLSYGGGLLDIYRRPGSVGVQPTIIWTHGGAWLSGDRSDYAGYYARLADAGFTVVSVGYPIAPEHRHPTAVQDLNRAHAYLLAHGEHLGVDVDNLILAGDSAGAQLSSQLAAAVTNPEAAAAMGLRPALSPTQLKGVVLNCGIFDIPAMKGGSGLVTWGISQALWAYTGHRDFASSEAARLMSTANWVTADFPATYISGGNADPLTGEQSKPLAQTLEDLGVAVTERFYPADHEPALAHEYQFDLSTGAARGALAQTIDFARWVTA